MGEENSPLLDRRGHRTIRTISGRTISKGSGQSETDLFCTLATGRLAPVVSQGKTAEEFEKRLDSALLKGFGIIAIDNVNGLLEGDRLAQILTQGAVEVRVVGTQKNITVTPALLIKATGVNFHVVDDLRRRTLLCSLDAKDLVLAPLPAEIGA